MKLFPESAYIQLEFDKIKALLAEHCKSDYAKSKSVQLRIHTKKEYYDTELKQAHEFKQLLLNNIYFPNDFFLNISRDLKLLGIAGAVLSGEQFIYLRILSENIKNIFRWFDAEKRTSYPGLATVIEGTYYEKVILQMINEVLDDTGQVKDDASPGLRNIRVNLYRKRNELRKAFEKIISRLNKQGYLADIEESFLNGRRVVAVFAEQKRMVKGILHGESESRRTTFIEPEETIDLNNELFSLESEEGREVYRILRALTAEISEYAPLLITYQQISGEYDFIRGKARLATELNGEFPIVHEKAHVHLVQAYHPLLFLYNR